FDVIAVKSAASAPGPQRVGARGQEGWGVSQSEKRPTSRNSERMCGDLGEGYVGVGEEDVGRRQVDGREDERVRRITEQREIPFRVRRVGMEVVLHSLVRARNVKPPV